MSTPERLEGNPWRRLCGDVSDPVPSSVTVGAKILTNTNWGFLLSLSPISPKPL